MPNDFGWWFFTRDLCDWDLAKLYPVEKHDYGCGRIEFMVRKKPDERWLKIESYEGWWYGPFRLQRPDEKLISSDETK